MKVAVYRCVRCANRLSFNQKMYSHGVCPHCGAVSDGTIVDCDKTAEERTAKPPSLLKRWFGIA